MSREVFRYAVHALMASKARDSLAKDDTIAREQPTSRPVIDHLYELEAACSDLVNDDVGSHTMTIPVFRDALRRPWP